VSTGAVPAVISPDWPAPSRVRAASTERGVGVSEGPYARFNLGAHVGDDPEAVVANRDALIETLGLASEPHWLDQVHGRAVLDLDAERGHSSISHREREISAPKADGAVTSHPGHACVVMTADCVPVLFCDTAGTRVGIAHAGWRGLATGVLPATIASMGADPARILVWLGPAIGQRAYEVGEEVRRALVGADPGAAACFEPNEKGRWQADLYGLARRVLEGVGVTAIYGGGFCTYTESERFFSHRREAPCGRMATLIWLDP